MLTVDLSTYQARKDRQKSGTFEFSPTPSPTRKMKLREPSCSASSAPLSIKTQHSTYIPTSNSPKKIVILISIVYFQIFDWFNLYHGNSFPQTSLLFADPSPARRLPSLLFTEKQTRPSPTPAGAGPEGGLNPGPRRRRVGTQTVRLGAEDSEGVQRVSGEEKREQDRGDQTRGR